MLHVACRMSCWPVTQCCKYKMYILGQKFWNQRPQSKIWHKGTVLCPIGKVLVWVGRVWMRSCVFIAIAAVEVRRRGKPFLGDIAFFAHMNRYESMGLHFYYAWELICRIWQVCCQPHKRNGLSTRKVMSDKILQFSTMLFNDSRNHCQIEHWNQCKNTKTAQHNFVI